VLEYDVDVVHDDGRRERVTLLGKIRFARFGKSGYRLLSAFWDAGFDAASPDGISVPEPIGTIGALRMWLQRKVPGIPATRALAAADGMRVAGRIADAAHKVHRAGVVPSERHTIADELRILAECFARMAASEPRYTARLGALLAACERLAASTPPMAPTGIHRDYYADQVIVDGARLYVIDFDLYCAGEPALDIGNFVGHLTEQSVRELGRPDGLADRERAIEERFVERSGEAARARLHTYVTLTLARHVYLSTTFAERRPFTDSLLALCEERLAEGAGVR
jgi:aminoglycoside phosphotransferase (APT) family kinase protein